jgi:hypothetical protein
MALVVLFKYLVVCLSKLFSSIFDFLPLRSTRVCYLVCMDHNAACDHLSRSLTSLVHARSQEELQAVFAGALCYTDLTGARQQSDRCLMRTRANDCSDRSAPPL